MRNVFESNAIGEDVEVEILESTKGDLFAILPPPGAGYHYELSTLKSGDVAVVNVKN